MEVIPLKLRDILSLLAVVLVVVFFAGQPVERWWKERKRRRKARRRPKAVNHRRQYEQRKNEKVRYLLDTCGYFRRWPRWLRERMARRMVEGEDYS